MLWKYIFLSVLGVFVYVLAVQSASEPDKWRLQNLTPRCLTCLCEAATGCDISRTCREESGYCGPYKIARIFWIEADNVTMISDDPQRAGAYEDCANNFYCAQNIITTYLRKFGKDCNGDGVTNCYDYMMVNFNGGYGCTPPLEENEFGRMWLERYTKCNAEEHV